MKTDMSKIEALAKKQIEWAVQYVGGSYENYVYDGFLKDMPSADVLEAEVYDYVANNSSYADGGILTTGMPPIYELRFLGESFIRGQIDDELVKQGYKERKVEKPEKRRTQNLSKGNGRTKYIALYHTGSLAGYVGSAASMEDLDAVIQKAMPDLANDIHNVEIINDGNTYKVTYGDNQIVQIDKKSFNTNLKKGYLVVIHSDSRKTAGISENRACKNPYTALQLKQKCIHQYMSEYGGMLAGNGDNFSALTGIYETPLYISVVEYDTEER